MDWVSIVAPIAMAVATALVSWGLSLLTAIIKSKVKNETVVKYLNGALGIVDSAVKETYQTYVQSLKAEGKFDKDAQLAALQKAKYTILSQLTEGAKEYLKEAYGDLDAWIQTQIEAKLYDLKNSDKTVDKVTE